MEEITYPSAAKRLKHSMCQPCIAGNHDRCPSPKCPCLCNDEVLEFVPVKKGIGLATLGELLQSA